MREGVRNTGYRIRYMYGIRDKGLRIRGKGSDKGPVWPSFGPICLYLGPFGHIWPIVALRDLICTHLAPFSPFLLCSIPFCLELQTFLLQT